MHKFWNFIRDDAGERILRLEGPIDEDDLWGDAVTPKAFRDELEAEEGDVTVWLNSPGGNVFAASEIYNMLRNHKGKVTVKIDAIAASAASVIAMAGDEVLISPVGMIFIHDPMTVAMGNENDLEAAIDTLRKVKESIVTAYQIKTGLSRNKISSLMSRSSMFHSKEAVDLGFADGMLFENAAPEAGDGSSEEENIEARIKHESMRADLSSSAIWSAAQKLALNAGSPEKSRVAIPVKDMDAKSDNVKSSDERASNKPDRKPDEEQKENDPGRGDDPDEDKPGKDPEKEDQGSGSPDKEADPNEDNPDDPKKPENAITSPPLIGIDGKTKDGAMPYELLRRELDLLR